MKREIKFRGKRTDNGEWAYGYYRCIMWEIPHKTHQIINGNSFFEVDPSTVGQYTGLKDKNSKDIYEGDIIPIEVSPARIENLIVGFNSLQWCMEGVSDWFIEGSFWRTNVMEIIGNIHENPEMIE